MMVLSPSFKAQILATSISALMESQMPFLLRGPFFVSSAIARMAAFEHKLYKSIPWETGTNMKKLVLAAVSSVLLLSITALSQEVKDEISVQGTGFFTKDTNGNGISRSATNTGGVLVGYRYHFNRWLSAEANYGYDRNTQKYFSNAGFAGVQSNVHAFTADAVVNLPLSISKFSPYVLAGGGSLIFNPTGNSGGSVPGADTQAKGAFLYGVGTNYVLSHHFSLRAEYRGFVYKNPDFGVSALNTGSWTHTAQPSAGIVYRF
jgi:opacity protein-like surface antigen